MKIKTQSFILISGILFMPIAVISLFFAVERMSFNAREAKRFEERKLELAGADPEESIARILNERPEGIDIAVRGPDGKVSWSSIDGMPVDSDFMKTLVAVAGSPLGGNLLIFGFTPPLPEGYSAVALVPRSFFLQPKILEDTFRIGIVALAAILIFATTMSIIMLRSITRSVLDLEDATRRVASGELDIPITVKGASEIASLSRSLDRLREEIKEENARRSRFIMGISHDLKTPLALVKGYAEALEEDMGETRTEARSYLGIIQSKADQLEGMIDDLIDFVRVDTGEWIRGLKHVELVSFLMSFAKRASADAALLGRRLRWNVDLPGPTYVRMDERLVSRVLENLVNNSLRYTAEGGTIEFSAYAGDAAYFVSVSDDGPGISPEDIPRIFEPFYRGSASRREEGMGLGLSIVKTVVESHGWTIEVEPGRAKGAAFSIRIPREGSCALQLD